MNNNKYFYISDNSIASKKQYYFDILNDIQVNSSKMLEDKEKIIDEINKLKEELLYINKDIKKENEELSIIDIDIYVCENDYIKTVKYENDKTISYNSIKSIVRKIGLLRDKRKELIKKRNLLVVKKKLLINKISCYKKRIKDIDRKVKNNNYNIVAVQNTLYTLDDILFSGVDVIKKSKITPKIKKRNKF